MLRKLCALPLLLLIMLLAATLPAAAAGIQVSKNEASADFPTALRFELEASSDSEITEVVLLYAIGLDEVLTEVRPEFEPGREVSASYERDTEVYFLPTGVTVRYKWELRDESGALHVTPFQELRYEDERFDWQERTERGVTVRWYDGDDEFGDQLMEASLRTLDRFERELGGKLTDPVRITIYGSTSDMRAALPPNSEEWVGGQARPDLGLVIGAIEAGDEDEIKRLVPHELSHLVLHQVTENSYGGPPPWFDEGLALVNEEVGIPGFNNHVLEAASEGRLIPLSSLSSGFPPDRDEALLSYAQSASVVRHIKETHGNEKFAALVKQFGEGASPNEATEAVLGLSIDELDAEWRQTLPAAEEDQIAPTATPALHAPPERFKIKTRPLQPDGTVEEAPDDEDSGDRPSESSGPLDRIPGWLISVGVFALGLLLFGGFLIARGLRR